MGSEMCIRDRTQALSEGGRAVFMSYQSLEDRIVKAAFKELTTSKNADWVADGPAGHRAEVQDRYARGGKGL